MQDISMRATGDMRIAVTTIIRIPTELPGISWIYEMRWPNPPFARVHRPDGIHLIPNNENTTDLFRQTGRYHICPDDAI
jgi:hypothetical protein